MHYHSFKRLMVHKGRDLAYEIILQLGKFKRNGSGILRMEISDNKTSIKLTDIKDEPKCGFDGERCSNSKLTLFLCIGIGG